MAKPRAQEDEDDLPSFEEALVELQVVKQGILAAGGSDYTSTAGARDILRQLCANLTVLREDLEAGLRDKALSDMTPEKAREAIEAIKLFEVDLRPPLNS